MIGDRPADHRCGGAEDHEDRADQGRGAEADHPGPDGGAEHVGRVIGSQGPTQKQSAGHEKCKHDGKAVKNEKQIDMIQCNFCSIWFHIECVGLRKDAKLTLWPCQKCCRIMDDIAEIKRNMADTNSLLNKSLTRAHNDIDNKEKECKEARKEINDLRTEIQQLRSQISSLQNTLQQKTWKTFRSAKSLLIGDSIIRDIDPEKLIKTTVKHLPGAKVGDIARHLSEDEDCEGPLSNVYVCVGTNDCSDSSADVDAVAAAYEEMVTDINARVKSPANVIVSSIPPRRDDQEHQGRVEALNKALQTVAQRTGATFIDNDTSFRLADNQINDGYLSPSDQLHLSNQGTNRLAKNLTLQVKQNCSNDVTKKKKKPSKTKPKPSPLAEQDGKKLDTGGGTVRDDSKWLPTIHRRVTQNEELNHEGFESYQKSSRRQKSHDSRHRCRFCAEFNHDASSCGFRKPAVCRQCHCEGHKQKFCSEFSH